VLARDINASALSDLKLYNVDKLEPSDTIPFSLSEIELFKDDKLVLYEFNVSNTLNPEIYNELFIFVVLSKLVNPLTFNEDNIVVLLFNVVNPLTFNDENNDVLLFNVVKPLIFNDEINVTLSFTNNSFKFENPLTFKFEYIVILSDVILFASMSFKPVEDKPQQFI
jgi:hypothetical protein